jgi:NTP pyrophosphatase (non-canonical NTP hydrolase)
MSGTPNYPDLVQRLREYRDDRDWQQFHTPKDLAIAVSTEAGELLEHFLWTRDPDLPDRPRELPAEIADVAIYLVFLCDALGVDLLDAMNRKLDENLGRHPVDQVRGRSGIDG